MSAPRTQDCDPPDVWGRREEQVELLAENAGADVRGDAGDVRFRPRKARHEPVLKGIENMRDYRD